MVFVRTAELLERYQGTLPDRVALVTSSSGLSSEGIGQQARHCQGRRDTCEPIESTAVRHGVEM